MLGLGPASLAAEVSGSLKSTSLFMTLMSILVCLDMSVGTCSAKGLCIRFRQADLAAGIIHMIQDNRQGLVDLAYALRVVVTSLLAVPLGFDLAPPPKRQGLRQASSQVVLQVDRQLVQVTRHCRTPAPRKSHTVTHGDTERHTVPGQLSVLSLAQPRKNMSVFTLGPGFRGPIPTPKRLKLGSWPSLCFPCPAR